MQQVNTVITPICPFISSTKLYARFCRYIRYTHIRQVMKMLSITETTWHTFSVCGSMMELTVRELEAHFRHAGRVDIRKEH